MADNADLAEIAISACAAELASRGMVEEGEHRLTMALAPGIAGSVGLPARLLRPQKERPAALVEPVISVRHEETGRVVSLLRGFPSDDHYKWSTGVVSRHLDELMPEHKLFHDEWLTTDESTASESARRIADDVVLYGFPFMERLRTPDAILEEMKLPPHKFVREYDLAVLLALQGQPAEARAHLMSICSPISHNPTTWEEGDEEFAAFLESFERYFDIDLRVDEWPLDDFDSEDEDEPMAIDVRDSGVVRSALQETGQGELARQIANLTDSQLQEISRRTSEIFAEQKEKNAAQAISDAAVEIIH